MNALTKLAIVTFFGIALISPSSASDRGTKPEAIALVQKAIAYFKAHGKEKAFAEINNKSGQFVDRDMYVYVLNTEGVMLANGVVEKMVGKQLTALKDADGKPLGAELQNLVKSGKPAWIDYKWPNPVTGKIESKTTYVEPVGDLGFAVGIYRP
jgi:signal transduction histidine kinase